MGSALCLLSAACFGALAVFGKLAYAAGVTPGQLLVFRFVIACAVLAVALAVRPNLRKGQVVRTGGMSTGRAVAIALGLGAFGYATQSTLYFTALQHMDASLLSLIFYTYPVLVTVASVVLRRARLTATRVAALSVASLGTVLVLLGAAAGALDLVGDAARSGHRGHLHRLHPRRRDGGRPAAPGRARHARARRRVRVAGRSVRR